MHPNFHCDMSQAHKMHQEDYRDMSQFHKMNPEEDFTIQVTISENFSQNNPSTFRISKFAFYNCPFRLSCRIECVLRFLLRFLI